VNSLPEGRKGKVLALSIGVLLLCALHVAVVLPLHRLYAANAQTLTDRIGVLKRYERAAADLPGLRDEAEKGGSQVGQGRLLLAGSSDAVAAADLQSTLKDLVEGGGATLESAQTLPAETIGNFRRVGVRLSFAGNLEVLTAVLLGVEASSPVLSVGSLELHSSDEETGEDLAIAMDVYGFRSQ
jgi:general secretion pathway protein M